MDKWGGKKIPAEACWLYQEYILVEFGLKY